MIHKDRAISEVLIVSILDHSLMYEKKEEEDVVMNTRVITNRVEIEITQNILEIHGSRSRDTIVSCKLSIYLLILILIGLILVLGI